MFYITGDTHCPIDTEKLYSGKLTGLSKSDYLIICGDAGLVWYDREWTDKYWQEFFEKQPYTTLFVDGNHENHAKLDAIPVKKWCGGKVHKLMPSVIHLMRGQVYDIAGLKLFSMGGANSIDKAWREENVSWWRREMPSKEEYAEALRNLETCNWKVDYVVTHCAPTRVQKCINPDFITDELTDFLDSIFDKLTFHQWFFGHYHVDMPIEQYKCMGLYDRIVRGNYNVLD